MNSCTMLHSFGRSSAKWFTLLVALLWIPSANAYRQPNAGGKIVVALPPELAKQTIEAHLTPPLVERIRGVSEREALSRPSLPGFEDWRSPVLESLSKSTDSTSWALRIKPGVSRDAVTRSLQGCLIDEARGRWPQRALAAASIKVSLKTTSDERLVLVRFSRALGPMIELLEGCVLVSERAGTFVPNEVSSAAQLLANTRALAGQPLVSAVEFRLPGQGGADVSLGTPESLGGAALNAPISDTILILQSSKSLVEDPLGLVNEGGRDQLVRGLSPELLLAVYWAGQGRRAEGILPAGMAPARPLQEDVEQSTPLPLGLGPLAAGATRVSIEADGGDPLLAGLVDRLSVLFRSKGTGIREPNLQAGELPELKIFRWRPQTLDPALALLALAGQNPSLTLRSDDLSGLLADDAVERLRAAMALERRWIDEKWVVPLMSADRWFALNSALRDVRIRTDGVPIFDDVHFGNAR